MRNASAGKTVRVASQVTYPTTVDTVARAIVALVHKPLLGTFAVADYPAVSRHALASMACDAAGIYRNPADPQILEVQPDTPNVAPRPVDSRLSAPFYGERADWRPWLKANAPLIAERERASASV